MIAEPPVLDRDHRVLHDLRRLAQRQPAPVIGTQRQEDGAVGGVDADRLPGGRLLERLEAGNALYRDTDRHRDRHRADQREAETPADDPAQPDADARYLARAAALFSRRFTRRCLLAFAAQCRFPSLAAPLSASAPKAGQHSPASSGPRPAKSSAATLKIGRASWGERVCRHGWISGVA